jgi:hypothetical protein
VGLIFDVRMRDINFRGAFGPEQTVRDARQLIAGLMNVRIANVRLGFAGREFKDSFVLGKLRMGDREIEVTIANMNDHH